MIRRKPLAKWIVNLLFVIGLLSAAAFRMLILFNYLSPALFRPVWYSAVVGYILFFLYRYSIAEKRRHAISESGLVAKLQTGQDLTDEDQATLLYVLQSLMVSRENWNYFAIFVLSIIAIIADIILSFKVS